MNPVLQALKALGGSGSIEEIADRVAEITALSDEQMAMPHYPDKPGPSEFEYRLAWSRTYLKKYGVLENSSRGIWALTPTGSHLAEVDPKLVMRTVKDQMQAHGAAAEEGSETSVSTASWRGTLFDTLLKMKPDGFERLVQRLLRECGFVQVEVTGRSGDGGIDGRGILRLNGLLSFHVIFQAKRWQGTVGPNTVRDFRGAMVGRADKGVLITTGAFSKEAVKEASRDGAPAIDLIDGDQLLDKLKELALGVEIRRVEVEQVTVRADWFAAI
jgi:restriction system protein